MRERERTTYQIYNWGIHFTLSHRLTYITSYQSASKIMVISIYLFEAINYALHSNETFWIT